MNDVLVVSSIINQIVDFRIGGGIFTFKQML